MNRIFPLQRSRFLFIGMIIWSSSFLMNAPTDGQEKSQKGTYTNPKNVDEDFKFQGEFEGMVNAGDDQEKYGIQVIAMGEGKFQAVLFAGGLPGAGYVVGSRREIPVEGVLNKDGKVVFDDKDANSMGVLTENQLTVSRNDQEIATFKRVTRKSKTLAAKPPEGAAVLYSGPADIKNWKNGKASSDGNLTQGTTSKKNFGSQKLHIEFLLPYKPTARGQGRGNSGIYVQGRWEIQMLDSFGLTGEQNECGGIYSVAKPDVNMCFPPLTWQTYDIELTAEKYEDGELKSNARITVFHNGVKIHDDVELPHRKTTAAPNDVGDAPGPIFLQNHGNPVQYRNIWVLEK